ncbi:MAG: biotin/lipoyl-containing protein [Acidaminobacteraceae bacterium]
MKIDEIKELMNEVKKLNLSGFKYINNGIELNIENLTNVAAPFSNLAPSPNDDGEASLLLEEVRVEKTTKGETINSPIVGVFYKSSSPELPSYVSVGEIVKKGAIVCIVEAMKVMNEITAEHDMKIISIEASDGEMVEFNQQMFTVERV